MIPDICFCNRACFNGGDLNPGEQHSRVIWDDGTVMLCALRAATVLSHLLRRFWSSASTEAEVALAVADSRGETAPLRTKIVPLTAVWKTLPSVTPLFVLDLIDSE